MDQNWQKEQETAAREEGDEGRKKRKWTTRNGGTERKQQGGRSNKNQLNEKYTTLLNAEFCFCSLSLLSFPSLPFDFLGSSLLFSSSFLLFQSNHRRSSQLCTLHLALIVAFARAQFLFLLLAPPFSSFLFFFLFYNPVLSVLTKQPQRAFSDARALLHRNGAENDQP